MPDPQTPQFTDPAVWLKKQQPVAKMTEVANESGARITSTTGGKHNPGSKHKRGEAIDFGAADTPPEEFERIANEYRRKGYKVTDERQRPPGQKVWSGPHGHVEWTPDVDTFAKFTPPDEWEKQAPVGQTSEPQIQPLRRVAAKPSRTVNVQAPQQPAAPSGLALPGKSAFQQLAEKSIANAPSEVVIRDASGQVVRSQPPVAPKAQPGLGERVTRGLLNLSPIGLAGKVVGKDYGGAVVEGGQELSRQAQEIAARDSNWRQFPSEVLKGFDKAGVSLPQATATLADVAIKTHPVTQLYRAAGGAPISPLAEKLDPWTRQAKADIDRQYQEKQGIDPNAKPTISSTLGSAIGGSVPLLAGGALGTGAKGVAAIGAGMNAQQVYAEARAAGATPEQASQAATIAAPIGALEGAFGAEAQLAKAGVSRMMARKAAEIIKSAPPEVGQEVLTQALNNINKAYVAGYAPDTKVLDGMVETVIGSLGVTAGLGGAGIAGRGINRAANAVNVPTPPLQGAITEAFDDPAQAQARQRAAQSAVEQETRDTADRATRRNVGGTEIVPIQGLKDAQAQEAAQLAELEARVKSAPTATPTTTTTPPQPASRFGAVDNAVAEAEAISAGLFGTAKPSPTTKQETAKVPQTVEILPADVAPEVIEGTRLREVKVGDQTVTVRTPKGMDKETARILVTAQMKAPPPVVPIPTSPPATQQTQSQSAPTVIDRQTLLDKGAGTLDAQGIFSNNSPNFSVDLRNAVIPELQKAQAAGKQIILDMKGKSPREITVDVNGDVRDAQGNQWGLVGLAMGDTRFVIKDRAAPVAPPAANVVESSNEQRIQDTAASNRPAIPAGSGQTEQTVGVVGKPAAGAGQVRPDRQSAAAATGTTTVDRGESKAEASGLSQEQVANETSRPNITENSAPPARATADEGLARQGVQLQRVRPEQLGDTGIKGVESSRPATSVQPDAAAPTARQEVANETRHTPQEILQPDLPSEAAPTARPPTARQEVANDRATNQTASPVEPPSVTRVADESPAPRETRAGVGDENRQGTQEPAATSSSAAGTQTKAITRVSVHPDPVVQARRARYWESVDKRKAETGADVAEYGKLSSHGNQSFTSTLTETKGRRLPALWKHPELKKQLGLAEDADPFDVKNAFAQDLAEVDRSSEISPAHWDTIKDKYSGDWSTNLNHTVVETLNASDAYQQRQRAFENHSETQRAYQGLMDGTMTRRAAIGALKKAQQEVNDGLSNRDTRRIANDAVEDTANRILQAARNNRTGVQGITEQAVRSGRTPDQARSDESQAQTSQPPQPEPPAQRPPDRTDDTKRSEPQPDVADAKQTGQSVKELVAHPDAPLVKPEAPLPRNTAIQERSVSELLGELEKGRTPTLTEKERAAVEARKARYGRRTDAKTAEDIAQLDQLLGKKEAGITVDQSIAALQSKGIKGDALENARDLATELQAKGAVLNSDGTVTLYHRTSAANARQIVKSKAMTGKEDGLFFSTRPDGQIESYGDTTIKVKVPLEKALLDDVFDNEAHVRLPLENARQKISVQVEARGKDAPESAQKTAPALQKSASSRIDAVESDIQAVRQQMQQVNQEMKTAKGARYDQLGKQYATLAGKEAALNYRRDTLIDAEEKAQKSQSDARKKEIDAVYAQYQKALEAAGEWKHNRRTGKTGWTKSATAGKRVLALEEKLERLKGKQEETFINQQERKQVQNKLAEIATKAEETGQPVDVAVADYLQNKDLPGIEVLDKKQKTELARIAGVSETKALSPNQIGDLQKREAAIRKQLLSEKDMKTHDRLLTELRSVETSLNPHRNRILATPDLQQRVTESVNKEKVSDRTGLTKTQASYLQEKVKASIPMLTDGKLPEVTISVPGDGEFRVRSEEGAKNLLKRIDAPVLKLDAATTVGNWKPSMSKSAALPRDIGANDVTGKSFEGSSVTGVFPLERAAKTDAWLGNKIEKGEVISDGESAFLTSALAPKDAAAFAKEGEGRKSAQEGAANLLSDVFKTNKVPLTIEGATVHQSKDRVGKVFHSQVAILTPTDGVGAPVIVDAAKLRTVLDATGANKIRGAQNPEAPIAFYKDGKEVAVLMPLRGGIDNVEGILKEMREAGTGQPVNSKGGFTTSFLGTGAFAKFNEADIPTLARHFVTHAKSYVNWARAVMKDLGARVRPHLAAAWRALQTFAKDETGALNEKRVVELIKKATGTVGETVEKLLNKAPSTIKDRIPDDFKPAEFFRHLKTELDKIPVPKDKAEDAAQVALVNKSVTEMIAAIKAGDGKGFVTAKRDLERFAQPRSKWNEIISSTWKAGLLTGLKTAGRNITGNAAYQVFDEYAKTYGSLADLTASALFDLPRTYTGASLAQASRSFYEAATTGVKQAKEIMKEGVDADTLHRLQLHGELKSGSKTLDFLVNGVFRTMAAQDKVFNTYAFNRSIEDRAKALALTERRTNKNVDVKARAKQLVEVPTEDMIAGAAADALVATFNNSNKLSDLIGRRHEELPASVNLGIDFLLPFDRTPTNIIMRMFDASPYGWGKNVAQVGRAVRDVRQLRQQRKEAGEMKEKIRATINKAVTPEQQRAFAQTFGRASAGTSLIALGFLLGQAGLATATTDDKEDTLDRERNKITGKQGGAIKIDGVWYQTSQLAPLGALIAVGAELAAGGKNANLTGATADAILDIPLLKAAKDTIDTLKSERSRSFKAGRILSSVVPTIVSDVAAAVDTKERKGEGVADAIKMRFPFARHQVPEAKDALGRSLEHRRLNAINPFVPVTTRETNDVTKEIARLKVNIGQIRPHPSEDRQSFERRRTQQGERFIKSVEVALKNGNYQKATDADKKESLEILLRAIRSDETRKENKAHPVPKPTRPQLRAVR